ncbi:GspE/PulE family protein [Anaerobacillus sp. MEB173]|uniref:GspE/PulE family protein n=1 Tax=Anaerobacillus sp. MEB173 TaxID=3383345 RepID=UPI003F8E59DC
MARKRLGDLLVESGLVTEEQLEKTLKEKSRDQKLGDALLQEGYITEQQLIEVLEFQLGIPHISLYRYPIDTSLIHIVPKDLAKRHNVLPLKKEGNKLFVAMADPMDYFAIEEIRMATGFQVEPAISTKDELLRTINKYYELQESMEEVMSDLPTNEEIEETRITDEESPIVRLVNQIISQGVGSRASDVHIDPQENEVRVRYRIDGVLRTERTLPKHMQSVIIARIKIMANLNITESRIPQDGRMKLNINFKPVDIRLSTLPTVYGEKIVMRILDLSTQLNDIEKIGFNRHSFALFSGMISQPNGIVLITGPTGSGKSSTLYAALNKLNNEEVNIITIEDPVEYQLEGINQIQVNGNIGMTFAKGLRAILRQDPDIVMVGEIRDQETAEIAVRASLTGHLVLSTLHTNDSIGTITRLVDMDIEPFLIASSLAGVVSQRLVRRICRDCQESYQATEREKEIFKKRGLSVDTLKRGRGCHSCNMTGYRGRLAIQEVLKVDEQIKGFIMNNRPVSEIRHYALKSGTIFLIDDGLLKVKQGLTTTEEVLRVTLSD